MKNRLGQYLNQTADWRRAKSPDAFAHTDYAPPVCIAVRRESKRRLVRDGMGRELVSNATIFCEEGVQPGDLLGGRKVLSVAEWVDKHGFVCGYEVCV